MSEKNYPYQTEEMEKEVEFEVNEMKIYNFPEDVKHVRYKDKNLLICQNSIMWLVLTDEELEVYNFLKSKNTIKKAVEIFGEEVVQNVIIQIEAKDFENPIINNTNEMNIYIYLTNRCNCRCKHCYMYSGDKNMTELTAEDWQDFLIKFKAHGGTGITFTGGEILVYKDYEKVLRAAHELGLIVGVLSNGTLWDEKSIKKCAEYIDEIQISVDGYDRRSYYAVRRYDGFDKAIETIKRFDALGVKVTMAVTPLFNNLDRFISRFEAFVKEFSSKHPKVIIKVSRELITGRCVNNSKKQNQIYRQKLTEMINRLWKDQSVKSFVLNNIEGKIKKNCGFGGISIAANGDVFWCNRIFELNSIMNIKNDAIEDIISASKKIKEKTSVDNSITCCNCPVKHICGGGCRMDYPGIKDCDNHEGMWHNVCPAGMKERIYQMMTDSNEYFYK